ncbi:FT-interacting protein 4-like [Triticum dicoccoides]|uniref:FT-interacting protein 4-like n=1 Tax=Triticum dicoccoides TaxID=85692 RepID=UPI001890520D|nr:FT-interacting protein 4-like [Triticum dicoccoides]
MEHKACTARSDLQQMLVDETAVPKALPLSLLEDITDDFSDDREIGRGGFAVVYKGVLGDRSVAVKKLSKAYMHEMEFHREVECLMRVKHKNVVRFLGYCADRQGSMAKYNGKLVMADVHQRLLCFEYIPKGSLDKYIIDANREWRTCYKIIKGICAGLQFLHENHVIHLDLKPANILLDDSMVPKITDFGLSRCFDENQSRDITKTILGTMGYLAPELREGGIIARNADLYSLGVIIIEILTGQKGYQPTGDVLESWSDKLERSQRDTLCEQIRVCYEIALECRDFNPKKRPASARDIIDRLHEMESIQVWNSNTLLLILHCGLWVKELRKSAIGILEMGILCARNLIPMKAKEGQLSDPYCVVKYGEKWVRTNTLLNTLEPRWNALFTWDVFDFSTVVTVAVFDDCHLSSSSHGRHDARDQQIGKTRIRVAMLDTDRAYTHFYRLITLTPAGVKVTGELQLAVRFTCISWPKMLAMYGKPLLHKMNHTNHIPAAQQDYLRFQAVQMVAKQLERAEPPLRKEVVEYMLDFDSYMFSLRRTKANFYRLTSLFVGVAAIGKWFNGICSWKNPLTTILVHVVFLILVCYSKLILPMVLLCMIAIAAQNYRWRPWHTPHMDMRMSQADYTHPDELDEEFDMLPPTYKDTVLSYLDQVHQDELNTSKRSDDIVRMRYDRLRGIAGRVQTAVGNLATQVERTQLLLRWHDPRLTPVFLMLFLVVSVLLYLTPFRVVVVVFSLYLLRHPRLRSNMPNLLFNLYSRLPSNDVTMQHLFFGN